MCVYIFTYLLTYFNCVLFSFVFPVITKPNDCIFPFDFRESVQREVSLHCYKYNNYILKDDICYILLFHESST